MMIELNELKHQCRIDADDDHDDQHLLLLMRAAQRHIITYLNRPVRWERSASTGDENEIPMYDDIKLAVLMLVATWYENRESVSDNAMRKVPMTVDLILGQYRLGTSGYLSI